MADSATIVAASLNSDQLETSINDLVSMVAKKTKEMADNFTGEVKRMEDAVKNLGNIKIDSGSAADGGSSRRATLLKKEEEQGKAVAMSYDSIAASNKRASDSAVAFLDNERQAYRARQREIEFEIKKLQTRYNSIKINPIVTDDGAFSIAINNIKQKIQEARQKLQEVPQTSMLGKQFSQELQNLRAEMNNLIQSRKAFEAQGKISNLQAEYAKISESLISLGLAYRRVSTEEKLLESAINNGTNVVSRYGDSADKAYQKMLKLSFDRAMNISTGDIDLAMAKLERLKAILSDERFMGALSPAQIKRARSEVSSLENQLSSIVQRSSQKSIKTSEEEIAATKRRVEAERQAAIQNGVFYQNLRQEMRRSGLQAQETSRAIMRDMFEQLNSGSKEPIRGLKELENAIVSMRRAFFDMDSTQRQSPLGVALENDIKKAQDAITLIQKYNRELSGVQFIGKDTIGSTRRSYDELRNTLSQLTKEYYQLNKADRDAAKGTELRDKIHAFNREIRDVQRTMARPTSLKKALDLDESTLDRINDKLQALRLYKGGLKITDPKQLEEMKQVDLEINRLQNDYNKLMAKNSQMIASNNALGRSWNYMKNRLAFYFTVGASTQFIKNLIDVRAQYEMNERALGILINSAERGTQIFNELSQMALVSPYTLIELSAAAKQLTAYDIAARDVVDTTRRLADMASAVGVPIERLTYALGQIKAYGYLNSRDARMFANAGIPLVKQLSDYYTELEGKMVSTADVYDRMKKKAIDYNSVMAVVTKMTDEGGKFFDFQAKMADTLKVRLANLTLAWNNMLNDMGKETQGVLTWSIGALRSLFLQWKNLYGALNEVSLVFGVAKALQFLGVCAHAAGVGFGSLNKYMTLNALLGTRLATTVRTLGNAFMSLVRSPLAWFTMAALLVTEIGDAFINADRATKEFNESLRDGAKTTYEDLKKFAEQYKNIRDSLYTTQKTAIGNIYDPSTGKAAATAYANQTVGQDISASEAKKVWEAMREQIELSSHASDEYISKLLSIENVSERLRQGFQILDDIQTVSAALKDIGDDGIKVTQGWAAWWNAWQGADGLIGNVKDLQKEIQRLKDAGQDPNDKFTKVIDKDYATALERFRKDLKVTTDSVIDFINLNGWSGDTGKIDEVFKQVTDRLATQSNLDPQTAFTLQREVEIARAKAAREALEIRIADEKKALAISSDEISKQQIQKNLETLEQQKRDFDKFNGENRAYWNDFTKYIKERHISELTAAYNSMTDHGKKAMDFQSEEWQKYVHDWANRYEKSHNLATDSVFNRLRNWINDANTWSVFIKMTISTEDGKSVYKQLEEYDKAADDAWKTMQRLDKRISQLRKKGAKEVEGAETGAIDLSRVSQDDRELTEALKERTQAQKDYNDAVKKGGESKKENSAASKAQKQAESELAKALKDELKLIETVRSSYKDLTKDGASHADAVEKSVSGYEKSAANINAVLNKYGIGLDLSKFAGISNPHELQKMLREQLNALVGKAKPTEIQALEVELKKVDLDVDKYDLTMITKGLNNELDKLKDEYELAVSLDADPELGNMFADWMGIDVNDLPRTASEYAERASKILNSKLKDLGVKTELPNLLNITDDDLRAFEGNKALTDKQLEEVRKYVKQAREMYRKEVDDKIKDWDKLLEKYAEYETKINKIQDDAARERVAFARQFGSDSEKSLALNLQTDILATKDPQEKQRLINELQQLIMKIAGDDRTKINLATSISNKNNQELAKANFEEFQKSPEWITATGDIASLTTTALDTLIDSLENYKKAAKNLDPKQVERINKALRTMRKEVRKDNPFSIIANAMEEAKARGEVFDEEISDIEQKIAIIGAKIASDTALKGFADQDDIKTLAKYNERLKELKNTQSEVTQISFKEVNEQINAYLGIAMNVAGVLSQIASTIKDAGMARSAELASDIVGNMQAAGQGFASGGWIGAVAAGVTDLVPKIFKWASMEAEIDDSIKDSERSVKRLELAYVDLQQAVDKAYGTAVIGAKQATLANKELQLAEIQRQIQLEKSRSGKNRDEDKIIDLQKQYRELFYEIQNGYTEIVDDLMGTNVASFAENLVSSMIDAFKQGEDYMKVFSDKFDEMIDNMIMKSIVSRVVSQYLDQIWDSIDQRINERSKAESDEYAKAQERAREVEQMSDDEIRRVLAFQNGDVYDVVFGRYKSIPQELVDKYRSAALSEERAAQARLDAASEFTGSDVDYIMQQVAEVMPELGEKLKNILGEYYKFGESSETQLSALQQGLQSMSESTANALEAYMNSVNQQVYYHSSLLEQIRDSVVGLDLDVSLGVQSQMLLQLQNSYQTQQAIQQILEGVLVPSGRAFAVELIS